MPNPISLSLSGNYKPTNAKHRKWKVGVIGNGESWPRVFGSEIASSSASSSDFYRLGIIPAFDLAAVTTTSSGISTAGTYGVALVYRSTKFFDGLTGDGIQGNRSNIQDVTLTATQAAVLTKVTTTDTKVDKLDIYAAIKVDGVYGTFYRVVLDAANSAGTVTFNIQSNGSGLIGAGVTNGTADDDLIVLATDNDYPTAQPIILEASGRLISCGGIVKRVTASFTNASSTVTTNETIYDGIEFWFIKRDSDTTGGIDNRGTYLCRYASSTSVTLVNADGSADTYDGTTGSGTASIYTEPNRQISKPYNPHSFPLDNVNNDYPSAIIAAARVPNTNRVLLMGSDWVIAEDYDRLPITGAPNVLSDEYGGNHFSIVAAQGRLWWLDFNKNKRKILCSDGSNVISISTQKIQNILDRVTLDANGDVWRAGYIHGGIDKSQDTIRWGLYLDNSTVANYVLELDIGAGNAINDPQFYPLRVLDAFTYGSLRGRLYIGQFGWTGGIARLGVDNVPNRFRDWVGSSGSISGSIDSAGQTTTVITVTGASFVTSGDGLKGIQLLLWKELDSSGNQIANRTYYHCRISANTGTTLTINYVETMNVAGIVTAVGNILPETPSGTGWRYRVGVIQGIIGPKWFNGRNPRNRGTFRDLTVIQKGQNLSSFPLTMLTFNNLDNQPVTVEDLEIAPEGQQVANTSRTSTAFSLPKSDPVSIHGFAIHDNNVSGTDAIGMQIEQIVLNFNEAMTEGDG